MNTLVVANWKMHGSVAFAHEWALAAPPPPPDVEVAVCPPLPYLPTLREALPPRYLLGAQTVAAAGDDGARTGEVSARMLADVGCALAIVGHSERRAMQGEDDAAVSAKVRAAAAAGLRPVLCVGEDAATRARGAAAAADAVLAQVDAALDGAGAEVLRGLVIAYEPIWAIGSGRTPAAAEVGALHDALRARLVAQSAAFGGKITLLYGGSVNADNAKELIDVENVNGFLVGGASLKPDVFGVICHSCSRP